MEKRQLELEELSDDDSSQSGSEASSEEAAVIFKETTSDKKKRGIKQNKVGSVGTPTKMFKYDQEAKVQTTSIYMDSPLTVRSVLVSYI